MAIRPPGWLDCLARTGRAVVACVSDLLWRNVAPGPPVAREPPTKSLPLGVTGVLSRPLPVLHEPRGGIPKPGRREARQSGEPLCMLGAAVARRDCQIVPLPVRERPVTAPTTRTVITAPMVATMM